MMQENRYYPPLYIGKSFFCYRDVNKAIDKHREIYGLRLALKRAVKLENYRMKIENMKDLNLRLKYGELDYHCFVATGRPGRPGNDERCHQLVRLRLSPDARCLIVYESHDHNITPHLDGQIDDSLNTANLVAETVGSLPNHSFCLKGDVTVTPIYPDSIQVSPILPRSSQMDPENISCIDSTSTITGNNLSKNTNLISTLEGVTVRQPNNLLPKAEFERNSITITPTTLSTSTPQTIFDTSADNPEKITLTIKKSECVPNEMVVVGSLRHVEEQKKSTSPSEMVQGKPLQQFQKTVTTIMPIAPKPRIASPSINSNQLPLSGIKCPVTLAVNNLGPSRHLVNIAPKLPGVNYSKSPIINSSKPPTSCKPINRSINTSEQELIPNFKLASSTHVPKVTDSNVPESIKPNIPVKHILPVNSITNKLGPATISKQSENLKIALGKEILSIKPPQKVNSSGGLSKPVGNAKLPVMKPTIKAKQVTVLKQSPNMKQVIINKPSPKDTLVGKPAINRPHVLIPVKSQGIRYGSPVESTAVVKQGVTKLCQNIRTVLPAPKPNGANSPPVSTTTTVSDAQSNKSVEKVSIVGKCMEKTVLKSKNITKSRDHPKVVLQRHPVSLSPNESQKHVPNQVPVNKIMNYPKKLKKKLGRPRPPDSSNFNARSSNVVDTELGYNEKLHIAHGVLFTLLKVTSHLPMVEFSDALETFELLTDAFRLNHKVSLSIKHDEEDDICSLNKFDYHNEEIKSDEKDFKVSSTTDDDKLTVTQIDGQFDNLEFLKEFTSNQDVSPLSLKIMPELEEDIRMEVDDDSSPQIENVITENVSKPNYVCDQETNSKGVINLPSSSGILKRTNRDFESSGPSHKRLKQ